MKHKQITARINHIILFAFCSTDLRRKRNNKILHYNIAYEKRYNVILQY